VCTPELASTLRSPDDLRNATLIVVSNMPNEWPHWFEAARLRSPPHPAGEASFESNAMAMQAALDGVGVAIAQFPYVSDALATGRLVAPFPIIAHTRDSWFLEYRPVRREDPALLAFREWLHQEADRERQVETELVNRGSMGAIRARTKVRKR
jgi:LysR family glycine cleavage system transcriptional activator/LysR family transcriptional regulator of beta-lactamase